MVAVQLTTARAPLNAVQQDESGLPWCIVLQPFGGKAPDCSVDDEFDVFAEDLARCERCYGYINKFATFERRRWRCPLCGAWTTLSERYASPPMRTRMPELSSYVYECFASFPGDGPRDRPAPRGDSGPVFLALIDLASSEEFVEMVKSGLLAALEGMPPSSRVALIPFSDRVGLYDLSSPSPHVRHVSARPDGPVDVPLHDLFPPERALASVPSARDALSFAIDTLAPAPPPAPFAAGPARRAFGSALLAALDFLSYSRLAAPARILCFLSGIPNYGPGALDPFRAARAAEQRASHHREDAAIREATPFYREQGERAAALGAACDVYVVSRDYVDLASIAPLASATDGALRLYDIETTTLPQDLFRAVHDPCAWDGELRVRCSPEFRAGATERPTPRRPPRGVYGPLAPHPKYEQVYKLACCRPHTSVAFDLQFSTSRGFENLDRDPCVQVAFSFTELVPPGEEGRAAAARRLVEDWLVYLTARYNASVKALLGPAAGGAAYHPESIAHYGPILCDKGVSSGSRAAALGPIPRLVYLLLCDPLLLPPRLPPPPAPRGGLLPVPDGPLPRPQGAADRFSPDSLAARRHALASSEPLTVVRMVRPYLEAWESPEAPGTTGLLLTREAMAASSGTLFFLDAYDRAALYYPPMCTAPFPPPLDSPLRTRINACRSNRSVTTQIRMLRAGVLGAEAFDEEWLLDDAFAYPEDPCFPAPPRVGLAAFIAHVLHRTGDFLKEMS
eukprot:tig00020563_g11269.t1